MAATEIYFHILTSIVFRFASSSISSHSSNCSTNFRNATVNCEQDQFYDLQKQICIQCRICLPGFGAVCPCMAISNTDCRECPNGTFSKWNGNNRFCTGCRKCRNNESIVRKCNRTMDTICGTRPIQPRIKKGNYQTYWWVIGILTFLLVVVTCILTVTIYVTRKRRRELRERRTLEPEHRETDASLASEALLCDGSSFSSLEDSRWRRGCRFKNDADSMQSSLLSSDNHSGSDRCSLKTLKHPEVLISTLPASVFQGLGRRMNPTQQYRDWKTLAGRLKRTQMDIEHIRMRDDHDFTEKLLLQWQTSNPDATIGELFNHLVEMRREDAAAVLYEFDKQSTQRVETPV